MRTRQGGMALLVALSLGGCTVSTGTDFQSGFGSRSGVPGAAIVRVVFPADQGDYAALLEGFTESTAIETEQVPLSETEFRSYVDEQGSQVPQGEVVIGFDSSAPAGVVSQAIQVGTDYSCVVANQSWFTVNQVAMPVVMDDLTKPEFAKLLAIDDPAVSLSSQRWLSHLAEERTQLTDFLKAVQGQESAQSGSQASAVLRVDSSFLPLRTANNLGTSSQWLTLSQTCVSREVFVAAATANSLAVYLNSTDGQLGLARAGIAYPLSQNVQVPEEVSVVAPLPEARVTVLSGDAAKLADTVGTTWRSIASPKGAE